MPRGLRNETLFQRYIDEVVNGNDLAALDRYVSPFFIEHAETPPAPDMGVSAHAAYLEMVRTGVPDLQATIDDVFASTDRLAARTTWSGTHAGELFGLPATGRRFSFTSIDVYRLEGGRLAEHWGLTDRMAIVNQLGIPGSRNIKVRNVSKARRAEEQGGRRTTRAPMPGR